MNDSGQFQDAVGESGLAVIDVGRNAEIPDIIHLRVSFNFNTQVGGEQAKP
jgi:hypothetical protein